MTEPLSGKKRAMEDPPRQRVLCERCQKRDCKRHKRHCVRCLRDHPELAKEYETTAGKPTREETQRASQLVWQSCVADLTARNALNISIDAVSDSSRDDTVIAASLPLDPPSFAALRAPAKDAPFFARRRKYALREISLSA